MNVGIVSFSDVDYAFDVANALKEAHVSVSLYLGQADTIRRANDSDRPAQRIHECGLVDPDVKIRLFQLPRMRDPGSLAVARRIAQSLRDDGVDVAHILVGGGELWAAVLACLLRDLPVVSTMIIPKPNIGEYPPAFMVSAINRLLTYGSDVIVVNGKDHEPLVQTVYGVPSDRIHYVPLGPRTAFLRWSSSQVPEEPGTVLFFGRINQHKGLEYLVRAQPIIARQIPQARIVIAGHGKDLERCLEMIDDHAGFEIHDGFVPGNAAPGFFQRASVVAMPYISATTSGILMTAYVFAKAVVATCVGSLPEYVQDGVTGLLVPPADVEQLANAIVRLLLDHGLRQRMGQNAKRWADELQSEIAVQTLNAYERAISMHGSA
jgi:starch synthase